MRINPVQTAKINFGVKLSQEMMDVHKRLVKESYGDEEKSKAVLNRLDNVMRDSTISISRLPSSNNRNAFVLGRPDVVGSHGLVYIGADDYDIERTDNDNGLYSLLTTQNLERLADELEKRPGN